MTLSHTFQSQSVTTPAKLAALAYIKTERDAAHETAPLLDFITRWMQERNFQYGLACLDLLVAHKGSSKREDGVTPSILHELSQGLYTVALVEAGYDLPDPELLMCLNFTHDLGEEYSLRKKDFLAHFERAGINRTPLHNKPVLTQQVLNKGWEDNAAELMTRMAKKMDGLSLYPRDDNPAQTDNRKYFMNMLDDPSTVIAKFQDRIHNMATLIGVKAPDKHKDYIVETLDLRNTLIRARTLYPRYARAFTVMENIVSAQIYFNSCFLDKTEPDSSVSALTAGLPRMKHIHPLPAGIDPLQITQHRALETINWIKARNGLPITPSP